MRAWGLVGGSRRMIHDEVAPAVAARWRGRFAIGSPIRRITIVSAADATHGASLANLAASVQRHAPTADFVAWDLGLELRQVERLKAAHPKVRIRPFPFAQEPQHMDVRHQAGHYAWKPVIIEHEAAGDPARLLLWLDAGDLVVGSLDVLARVIARDGLYSPHSSGRIVDWTHPLMLERFNVSIAHRTAANLSGGIVGADPAMAGVRDLLAAWARCARDAACIAPAGSDRSNHRQDQSSLSILARQAGFALDRPYHRSFGWAGIAIHRDVDHVGTIRR
ncbi:MAG: hypothetical protein RL190_766 [Actinomycetota bacterium]|jgi:hypothetical protein